MLQSGKLRYFVAIEQKASTRDDFGAEQELWSTVAQVYAGFETLSGQELFAAQKLNADVTHKITIRYRAGIVAEMRVNWTDSTEGRNRIFDIIAPMDPTQGRQKLELLAIERNVLGDGAAPGPLTGFPAGYGRKAFNEAPDGNRMIFTLPGIPLASVFRLVIAGFEQPPSKYTLVGSTVTLPFAPASTDDMVPWY
jgi:SPP1 family predicted phage head-tail adaptor